MCVSENILTATTLRRSLPAVLRRLNGSGMPMWVARSGGKPLVLVEAAEFERLVELRHQSIVAGLQPVAEWGKGSGSFNAPL